MDSSYRDLPDNSRIWIHLCNREFTEKELMEIKKRSDEFIASWNAHEMKLRAAIEVFHKQFIVVFVDEECVQTSGCSVDKSVHLLKDFEKIFNVSLYDRKLVAYRDGKTIRCCLLQEIEKLLAENRISDNTIVFNNLITTKAELENAWEIPLKNSWMMSFVKSNEVDNC